MVKTMKNKSGILPKEYRVLIRPDEIEEKTAGGILIPKSELERHEMAQVMGVVVAVGGNAFSDWKDAEPPKPGDRVYFQKFQGAAIKGEDGREYRLVNDKDIGAVISDSVGVTITPRRALGKTEGVQMMGDGA